LPVVDMTQVIIQTANTKAIKTKSHPKVA